MNDLAIEDTDAAVDLVTKRVNPGEDEGGRAERRVSTARNRS